MGLYNGFKYNDGTLYGEGSPLDYSARPMVATAINYNQVYLEYAAPTGSYVQFRITRNQDGYPETAEDGKIIYESAINDFPTGDGILDTPLVEGRFAYYRAWLRRSTNAYWEPAGETLTLVPFKHTLTSGTNAVQSVFAGKGTMKDSALASEMDLSTTHQRFLSYLPSVLTSTSLSPVDEINSSYSYAEPTGKESNSLISKFFEGFSFTIDEFLSFAKLIIPDNNGSGSSPEILELKSFELGIKSYNKLATKAQKRLVRDALTIYGGKGTLNSLKLFTKDLTGYDTTVTETANLMLSHEDSTFDIEDWTPGSAIGGWLPGDGVTLAVTSDQTIATGITNSLDSVYCLKVNTTGSSQSLSYGTNKPINNGIPVVATNNYVLSMYVKGSSNITLNILWYDYQGKFISTSAGSSISTSSSWERKILSAAAPSKAVYAALKVNFASTGASTYYFDMIQFESPFKKVNNIVNPSFETDTTNWDYQNGDISRVSGGAVTGSSYSGRLTVSGSSSRIYQLLNNNPVVEGQAYSLSAYVKSSNISATVTLSVEWRTYGNNLSIRTDYSTGIPVRSSFNRVSLTPIEGNAAKMIAPANAATAYIYISFTDTTVGDTFDVDAVQFENSPVVTEYFEGDASLQESPYTEARGVAISLAPIQYNYILNPSFEVSTSGTPNNWTFTNLTPLQTASTLDLAPGSEFMVSVSTPATFSGAYSGKIATSYAGSLLTSKFYTYSIYAKSISGNQELTLILTDGETVSAKVVSLTDVWQRFSVSISCSTVPTVLTVQIYTSNLAKDFLLDSAQLEGGSVATDYFDGDRNFSGTAWAGDSYTSPSVYYPNLSSRIAHLMDSIKDYLPISTPYYITFYGSTDFTEVALSGIS